jgi:hypothetical protein
MSAAPAEHWSLFPKETGAHATVSFAFLKHC